MNNIEKRYEKKATIRPCSLNKEDLLKLGEIIQETFTRPEVERYFRVSTTLRNARVFSNSIADFLNQEELPPKITDIAFWIEGWDERTRFDKSVLLDFSRYSIQLRVEGTDPVWVHDKYTKIIKYLNDRATWYAPLIARERIIIFCITMILILNIIISYQASGHEFYFDKGILLALWIFFVFSDTRKIWPYANIDLSTKIAIITRENVITLIVIVLLIVSLLATVLPVFT
jgi:hypothetical protein